MALFVIPVLLCLLSCKKDGDTSSSTGGPQITTLVLQGDSLHIIGHFGADPGIGLRRVIVNETPVPEEKTGTWKEDEITVKVEREKPEEAEEKKVQVEVKQQKSNVKAITLPPVKVSRLLAINFLQVKEYDSFLYLHGTFGTDPGAGRRSIYVEQFTNRLIRVPITNIISWNNSLIVCQIPGKGDGSCGKVVVKVDKDSTFRHLYTYEGVLDYKRPQGGANGSLAEMIKFYIRLRGDGEVAVGNVPLLDLNTDIQTDSYANWEGSGEGSSSYNNEDGCGTIRVFWTTAKGFSYVGVNRLGMQDKKWITTVKHRRDGFDLRIIFQAANVISSKVTFTPCIGNASQEDRKESIFFDEFDDVVIPLRFETAHIIPGELKKTGLSSSAGLAWDAKDFPANLMTATLKWPYMGGSLE